MGLCNVKNSNAPGQDSSSHIFRIHPCYRVHRPDEDVLWISTTLPKYSAVSSADNNRLTGAVIGYPSVVSTIPSVNIFCNVDSGTKTLRPIFKYRISFFEILCRHQETDNLDCSATSLIVQCFSVITFLVGKKIHLCQYDIALLVNYQYNSNRSIVQSIKQTK